MRLYGIAFSDIISSRIEIYISIFMWFSILPKIGEICILMFGCVFIDIDSVRTQDLRDICYLLSQPYRFSHPMARNCVLMPIFPI